MMPEQCTTCQRHSNQHKELFRMLTDQQAYALQDTLCINVDCLAGIESEWGIIDSML